MFLHIPHLLSVENITIHDGEIMFAELAARLNPFAAPLSYQLLHSFDLFGTIVFASIGALVAYEQQRNSLSALLYAALTALGGGTIRDVLLGQQPVFWMRSPLYLHLALTSGLLTFVLAHHTTLKKEHFWLADGISLAIFTVVGIQSTPVALSTALFLKPLSCVLPLLLGLITGVAGGLMRDVIAHKTPCVLQTPSFAIASLTGGSLYLFLIGLQLPEIIAVLGAIAAVLLVLTLSNRSFFSLNLCKHHAIGNILQQR